ncbi:serine/threonine protein kinase [Coccidioides immitis RS]|uniref:Serine/threonine protein kinase n=3 Tax=Coccidioides immitis TaxID=5501 RepID=A0A0E1RV57_COCIM|nr:serine/threonine protein kinase [Coccidioides immitis RS]EAS29114.2 serine/threonine protein kinase [Coccidioides immitis RS]KMP06233.1 serine/threonine protein kinase [Coccidioides immitis RMSCC 2394]TPX22752.1 hypothetical protein DIZ76_014631 [Coccidioides immitis]
MTGRPGIGQKRFSHSRFQQLPDTNMASSNDATINIPLTTVPSQTGGRKASAEYIASNDPSSPHLEKNHLFHGRRVVSDGTGRQLQAPEDGTLTQMGRFYNKILNFSVVTRYFIYVLPLALLIAIPIIIGATAAQNARIGGVRIVWFFTWVEVVWLSLWVSKIIAHYIPFLFQFLCGIVSSGTRKYALILRNLEIPFSLVGWSVTSLATFIPLMTRNPDNVSRGDTAIKKWEDVVKNILFAAFISSLILAAEKVLIQLISISYHRKQFDLRIQASKRNVHLVGLLYQASRKMFPEYCKEFEAEDYIINDSIVGVLGKKGRAHKRTGSASPMRLIQNVGRVGDKITAAFGQVAHEITGKQVFNPTAVHSVVTLALEKRSSSEALARRLWMSFVLAGREALYIDDLYEVFGPDRRAEAEECFAVLDRDNNGDISLEEMILTITEFGRDRQAIAKSMHDVDQAIHVLDNLLCTVVFILVILVFVAFLNKGFGTTLAAGATALLSLSFVFAVTAQEVLGSCIFLFVKHPYDVGDRVDINSNQLIVERISLLFTVFKNINDFKVTQVPNIVLNTCWIENISRSKAMKEQLTLTVDFGTTFEDVQLLKQEMQKFVLDKDNCRDFQADVDIEVVGVGNMDKMELKIEIRHKSNWSNETVRAARRSKFMCALVLALRKIPIYGPGGGDAALGDASKPSYSVSISHEQAQANKEQFSADKESKRMVPTSEMQKLSERSPADDRAQATGNDALGSPSGLSYRSPPAGSSEATFADALNQRPVALDRTRTDELPTIRVSEDGPLLRQPSTGMRHANPLSSAVSPNTPEENLAPSLPEMGYFSYESQFPQPQSQSGSQNPYRQNPSSQSLQSGQAPGFQQPTPAPLVGSGQGPETARRPVPPPAGYSTGQNPYQQGPSNQRYPPS